MLKGKDLANFCKYKIGTNYVYGAKGTDGVFTQKKLDLLAKLYPNMFTKSYYSKAKAKVGTVCCDCSGLISWYTGKNYGSSQLYAKANKRIPIKDWHTMPIGCVLWKQGHVGCYIGDGWVVEEKGINYGCVMTKITSQKWQYGLLFDWMQYDNEVNPYVEPTINIRKGTVGEGVKWVQYELRKAGFDKKFKYNGKTYNPVEIDGEAGKITDAGIRAYQQSCKLTVDGIVGPKTRACMKED